MAKESNVEVAAEELKPIGDEARHIQEQLRGRTDAQIEADNRQRQLANMSYIKQLEREVPTGLLMMRARMVARDCSK